MPVPTAVRALRILAAVALAAPFVRSLIGAPADRLDDFFGSWVYDGVIVASAALCLLRAVLVRRDRTGWACLAAGLLAWSAGEIHWTLSPTRPGRPARASATGSSWRSIPPAMSRSC